MHGTEHEENDTHFSTQGFKNPLRGVHGNSELKETRHKSQVDQVETDHQQVIHAVGQRFILVKAIDEKDPAILRQGSRDPNGETDAQDQVKAVSEDGVVHYCIFIIVVSGKLGSSEQKI